MVRALRGLGLMITAAIRADSIHALGALGVTVFESAIRASWPYLLKLLVDGAVLNDLRTIVIAASIYGTSTALLGVTNQTRVRWMQLLTERTEFLVDRNLVKLTTSIATIEHYERAEYWKQLDLLRAERNQLAGTLGAIMVNLMAFIQLGGSVLLLGSIHPLLACLPLFAIPSVLTGARAVALEQCAQEETVEQARTAKHLFQLATSAASAKELRVFGLGEHLASRCARLWDECDRVIRATALRSALLRGAGWAVFAMGYGFALIFVVDRAAWNPTTPIGDVVMAFSIAGVMNGQVGLVAGMARMLRRSLKTVERYLWLEDFERESRPRDSATPPAALREGIQLLDVSFRYPDADRPVLENVSVTIPAGRAVAVVGENGAGKTTLVKLLCGFYRPTRGSIMVDGQDLASLDLRAWRARTSAAFQDFAKFEFLARETVGVGELALLDDPAHVRGAIDRANAADVLAALPAGLDTEIGKTFEAGVELSVGQWQKLALARAMMRESPLVMVLDEPTASLDAQTEHVLFERYAGALRRVSATKGGITVLVSHRFSTVRLADVILVVRGGKIVESGSHAALMRRSGVYAELYELQARAYR